jgi:glyoxylase-like metal-dependent hydrolase (beta-lactamase superfamily II)
VLVAGFPAAAFGTNCYVLAPAAGEECLVVDPGVDVVRQLDEVLEEHRLQPVAVLLTHGHIDHTFSVTPVCGARDVPAYVHPGDRAMLADPMIGLSRDMRELFGGRFSWAEPDDVAELVDGAMLPLAGLEVSVDHAPGHTPGSVMFRLPEDGRELCLSGDVLFAGSIGRTDLPGGDHAAMLASLATKVLPLPDETVVLPGHGPRTTVGRERAANPFLADAAARVRSAAAPSRGL